jgi:hypothetical protein
LAELILSRINKSCKYDMKKNLALLFSLSLVLPLLGQLPNGSLAPDFNVQDINGNYVHLYDILNDNKIVLMEVTATWCPPCWSYHNSNTLKNFYNQHGPNGDNRARVYSVEGDPETNIACLYGTSGCNNYSPGDWVSGTPYPIIDNSSIANSYEVTYYPTLYIICPNKRVMTVGQLSPADLWTKALGCPVAFGQTNAGVFDYTPGTRLYEICDTMDLGPEFRLINLGSNALTAATIQMRWNDELIGSQQWTGNLPTYGETFISLPPFPANGEGTLKTEVVNINYGVVEDDLSNNVKYNSFEPAKDFNTALILLKLKTDSYGAETYWELRDEQNNVLDHGGNEFVGPNGGGQLLDPVPGPGTYGNNVLIKDTLFIPSPGCYSIHFVDYYGDGMCCTFGNGYYRLFNLNAPNQPVISGGTFAAYDSRGFGVLEFTVSQDQVITVQNKLEVYPNPAWDQVQIDLELKAPTSVSGVLVNALGQVLHTFAPEQRETGMQHWSIPVQSYANGLYYLQLQAGREWLTKRFVINHE